MNSVNNFIESNKSRFYVLLALFVLVDRFLVLHYFGFRYTGNDDTVMWLGAKDYLNGVFHEPFFYGQNYNYMVEALFAVPLLFFGVPVEFALPAVTSLMTLFPFFAFSYFMYRNKNFQGAFILMAIPLLLSFQYAMITSMSRGFVNGIFFVSFIPLLMSGSPSRLRFFLCGMSAAVAIAVNPNALVLLVPLFVYYFCIHLRNLNFYTFILCGIVPVAVLHRLALQFYISNPGYKMFELSDWRLTFHSEYIPKCLAMSDKLFKYLMPVAWNGGGFVFYFLVVLCMILFLRKKYMYAFSAFAGLVVIVYSFGLAKIQDGCDNLLLPYARMFLAVPLLYGILLSWISEKLKQANVILIIVFLLGASHFIYKSFRVKTKINTLIEQQQDGCMLLYPVSALKKDCVEISHLARGNNAQLIVGFQLSGAYLSTLFYGCGAMDGAFPSTIFAELDRRTWRYREEEKKTVRKNIVFIGGTNGFLNEVSGNGFSVIKISENPNVCILKNNSMETFELLRKLKIEIRKY